MNTSSTIVSQTIGIIGGSGALGGAIARALLRTHLVSPEQLWISNRAGGRTGFEDWQGVRFTTSNQELVDACQTVLLSVPPDLASMVDVAAADRLVISVMAGVTIERIERLTGATRVVRAMSSPAAEFSLAYSPWYIRNTLGEVDRATVQTLFDACGVSDEVPVEDQIDRFTAMTGPVPGFVAFYADCMVAYATKHGIAPRVADRAIRQLFLASGKVLSETDASPADHVGAMIEYAGTTAAGLQTMQQSAIAASIEAGLDAAYNKARTIA